MKYLIAVICFVFLMTSCDPSIMDPAGTYQSKQYKGKYDGKFEEGSTVLKEYYHMTVERTQDGKYLRKQFYPPNKQLTHFQTFSDKSLKTLDGKYKEWLDDGDVFKEGQFVNGKMEGEWKFYSLEGRHLASYGKYKEGEKTGLWTYKRKDGTTSSEYNYQNGKQHGVYKIFDKEGTLAEEGIYTNGERTTQNFIIQPEDRKEQYKIVERMPMFKEPSCDNLKDEKERKKCGETAMLKFIYGNIKYPRLAREEGIEGQALVSFVVDKEGKVIDRKVHRGLCLDVANEVSRIVDMMPNWNPGMQKDKPVKVWFNLPVKFKLE